LLTTFPAEALGCVWVIRNFLDIRVERAGKGFRVFTASLQ